MRPLLAGRGTPISRAQAFSVIVLTIAAASCAARRSAPEADRRISSNASATLAAAAVSPIRVAPTSTTTTLMRGGAGAYMFNRGGGKLHTGVDVVANQSSNDREIYRVMAVSHGVIAYSRLNGGDETGYGYTIVVDHGDGYYTQYSHLATISTSAIQGNKKGDQVSSGQTIGYLADLNLPERSSGNVLLRVVAPYDKIQLHFELFAAPSGRSSSGGLASIKKDYQLMDPTTDLKSLGYSSF
jgi:murein DD-endopeptidase MepM/ murein hydrolase activator NlpD